MDSTNSYVLNILKIVKKQNKKLGLKNNVNGNQDKNQPC